MGPLVISESGIGGQHGLIRPDRVRRAVGDLAPARHDDETPRDAQDGLHVVIDDNERPPTAVELANPLEELVTKPRMNAGERLVEEQHRGLQHQAAPELQQLLLATRQVLRRQRSEEHTSELQSLAYLVCRLLLEKKKKNRQQELSD